MQSKNQHWMQKWTGMIACYSNANSEQDIKHHFVLVKGEVACFGLLLCSFCEMEDKKQDHRINNPVEVEMKTKWFMISLYSESIAWLAEVG